MVKENGTWVGYSTDARGFLRALTQDGGFDPQGKAVLVLGAGGSARAVAFALQREGVASIAVANRTLARAIDLIEALGSGLKQRQALLLTPQALAPVAPNVDLIVNCTSLGMKHGDAEGRSPLTSELISPKALVFDLVYNPVETPLLKEAKRAGADALGGLSMLVYQGAASFELWMKMEAPVEVMLVAARRAMES